MRVSINGNNGHSRARIALGEAEVRHLTAGFDAADTVKIKVEGSAATGLRLVAGNIGTTLKRAQGQGLLELPTSAIEAIHEPVSQVEVETLTERDDYGPVLRSAPLPEPFSPPEMRRTARRRIADFVVQNPRAAAEGLFKGRSVVKREERKPVPWEFDHRAVNELEARRVAVIKCGECGCTQEMGLRSMLPDAQIAKKFSQAG